MSKKIVAKIFNYARAEGASGLVITSQADRVALHYHFPDAVARELSLPKKLEKPFLNGLRQVAGLAEGELLTKKYYKISDQKFRLDFYLSVLPSGGGEKIIIDIVRHTPQPWRLSQLGLERRDKTSLEKALRGSGLIVIAAPDGQGKSSTLRALLDSLDRETKNICLLDNGADNKPGINCLPAGAKGWNSLGYHDCDVVAAEDVNDNASLAQALVAAATGRLVILTMSATDTTAALEKIMRIKLLPWRLKADALKLIIAQKLEPLKKIRRGQKTQRSHIAIFETLPLSAAIKKFLAGAQDKNLTAAKFREKLRVQTKAEGFSSLADDRHRKTRAGIL